MTHTLRSIELALDEAERGYNMLRSDEDLPARDRWSRLRFAIIGGLLACPPAEGELQGALEALAARTWRHPFTGLDVRFGTSTIQRWYYAARKASDPVAVLRNQIRQDIGRFPSFSSEAAEALRALYAEHPGWNAQLLHDNLRVKLAQAGIASCASYPSVLRYLKFHGLLRRRQTRDTRCDCDQNRRMDAGHGSASSAALKTPQRARSQALNREGDQKAI